eukprot:4969370-Amphidinium_carterae.1
MENSPKGSCVGFSGEREGREENMAYQCRSRHNQSFGKKENSIDHVAPLSSIWVHTESLEAFCLSFVLCGVGCRLSFLCVNDSELMSGGSILLRAQEIGTSTSLAEGQ